MTDRNRALQTNRALLGGSFWTTLGQLLDGAAALATGIIGLRVLSPRDFGLMATVLLVLAMAEHLTRTGLDAALIQKEAAASADLDVAWTWQLLRGAGLAAVLCALDEPIADWYGEQLLMPLVMVSSLSSLLAGAANVGLIQFDRQLDFRATFRVRAAGTLLRVVLFIPAIFFFRSAWALVVAHVGGALVHLLISYAAHPHRPKWAWDPSRLKQLLSYGKWITAMAWATVVANRGDDLFISKYLGIAALGIYQLAFDIASTPATNFSHTIARIGLPTYARLQNDVTELRRAFVSVMRATLLITGPVSVLLYLTVPAIVTHVIGVKWAPAIPLARILIVGGFVHSLCALASPLFKATGRPDLDFKMTLPRAAVLILLWPAAERWGLNGVAWVVVIAIASSLPVWLYGVCRLTRSSACRLLTHNALAMFSSAALAVTLYAAQQLFVGGFWAALAALGLGLGAWLLLLGVIGRLTSLSFFGEVRRLLGAIAELRRAGQLGWRMSARDEP